MSDLLEKLREAFRIEYREHLEFIRATLPAVFEAGGMDAAALDDMYRRAHSLKGAARAVDFQPVEQVAHRLETLLAQIRSDERSADGAMLPVMEAALDAIEDAAVGLLEGAEAPDTGAPLAALEALISPPAEAADGGADGRIGAPQPASEKPAARGAPDDTVRVSFRHLDRLVASAGDLLAEEFRQRRLVATVESLAGALAALQKEWEGVRRRSAGALRRLPEAPELRPLARYLDGAEKRLRALGRDAGAVLAAGRESAWSQRRIAEQIQQDVREARMVPAESVFEGFRKMVRDLAADQGKQVAFYASGMRTVADRLVLQALKDPLMHLLRNAVSHGIEAPDARRRAGKPAAGRIDLALETEGSRLAITVSDDGRGLDMERLARAAGGGGGGTPPREGLVDLIFEPGFSTAEAVSEVSGRGIGLSVVDEAVTDLQGEVEVPERAVGFSILLRVPLSVSLQRLLLVACREQTFALPFHVLEQIRHVSRDEIASVEGELTIPDGDRRLPMAALAALLQFEDRSLVVEGPRLPVLVVRSGVRRIGIAVDRVIQSADALVKDLGIRDASVRRWFAGGIVLSDGTVCPVLNPPGLVESGRAAASSESLQVREPERTHIPTILVADDSFTTRTLEKSLLEAHGYRVREAVDGIDALQRARSEPVDLVITDLRMPRLDGFGLLEALKKEQSTRHIPVIIVSSIENREDKERGLALGADAYVVKRKFDQRTLLEAIEQML